MEKSSTKTQVSAGGVAYRETDGKVEVALISVGEYRRWQLPKGMVNQGETPEQAALREVREEAGINTQLEGYLDKIEYWYYAHKGQNQIRFHKYVHFYLLRYLSGDVRDHDHEVEDARWVEIHEAINTLTFEDEKKLVSKAQVLISSGPSSPAQENANGTP